MILLLSNIISFIAYNLKIIFIILNIIKYIIKYEDYVQNHDGLTKMGLSAKTEFLRVASQSNFPCTFGMVSARKEEVYFCEFSRENTDDFAHSLKDYLKKLVDMPEDRRGFYPFVAFIVSSDAHTLEEDQIKAWDILKSAMNRDESEWPRGVDSSPEDDGYVFCFGGEPWFVNISSPAHAERVSRNVGPYLSLIMQPVAAANALFSSAEAKDKARKKIRDRVANYDKCPHYEGLGPLNTGDKVTPSKHAYGIPDNNETPICPAWKGVQP